MGVSELMQESFQAIPERGIRQGNEIDVRKKLEICPHSQLNQVLKGTTKVLILGHTQKLISQISREVIDKQIFKPQ